MSANQFTRTLGISYKTAWYLCHRMREAMKCDESEKLDGAVEADETIVSGRYDKPRKRNAYEKPCVVGVIKRGGDVRAKMIQSRGTRAIAPFIEASVAPGSKLMTDDYAAYDKIGRNYEHSVINHTKLEYVVGLTHTNSIENFWSLFKRGV